jgi:hypothetical protein
MRGVLLVLALVSVIPTANADERVSSKAWQRVTYENYQPPYPVSSITWYLHTPLDMRERMGQSLCCALLPPVCGLSSCTFAAMTYRRAKPKHLNPDYLYPTLVPADPHDYVPELIDATRPSPVGTADEVLVLNTHVANLRSMEAGAVCTAIVSFLTGLGGDGSFALETASVLIFEKGQYRHKVDKDHQY